MKAGDAEYDFLVQSLLDKGSTKYQARRIAIQRREREVKIERVEPKKRGRPAGSKNRPKV